MERFGGIDILVNNAATNPYMGRTIDIDPSRHDKIHEVNLKAPLFWSQFAYHASLKDRPGASIINIASIGGLSVETSIGNYNVSKAALLHLTRTLAKELAPGVRVNSIAPGLVKTDMARALWETNEEAVAQHITMKRLGIPEDIANAALFLLPPMPHRGFVGTALWWMAACCSREAARSRGRGFPRFRIGWNSVHNAACSWASTLSRPKRLLDRSMVRGVSFSVSTRVSASTLRRRGGSVKMPTSSAQSGPALGRC